MHFRCSILFLALAALAACQGDVAFPPEAFGRRGDAQRPAVDPALPDMGAPEPCAPRTPTLDAGEHPLRRLSTEQYENTLLELIGPDLGQQLIAQHTFPNTPAGSEDTWSRPSTRFNHNQLLTSLIRMFGIKAPDGSEIQEYGTRGFTSGVISDLFG